MKPIVLGSDIMFMEDQLETDTMSSGGISVTAKDFTAKVLEVGPDVKSVKPGMYVVFQGNHMKEVVFQNETYFTIKEHQIHMAFIDKKSLEDRSL